MHCTTTQVTITPYPQRIVSSKVDPSCHTQCDRALYGWHHLDTTPLLTAQTTTYTVVGETSGSAAASSTTKPKQTFRNFPFRLPVPVLTFTNFAGEQQSLSRLHPSINSHVAGLLKLETSMKHTDTRFSPPPPPPQPKTAMTTTTEMASVTAAWAITLLGTLTQFGFDDRTDDWNGDSGQHFAWTR